jgi:hypothetical protein
MPEARMRRRDDLAVLREPRDQCLRPVKPDVRMQKEDRPPTAATDELDARALEL